jgi:hypothetical protein
MREIKGNQIRIVSKFLHTKDTEHVLRPEEWRIRECYVCKELPIKIKENVELLL